MERERENNNEIVNYIALLLVPLKTKKQPRSFRCERKTKLVGDFNVLLANCRNSCGELFS